MTSNPQVDQQMPLFPAIIPAVMAGYAGRKDQKTSIRPKIRPFWPDRLDCLLFNWLSRHFSRHCVASGIPQQIPQSLRDGGEISEAP